MTELIWDGKYKDGKKQGPVRIALPFQTVETVNESSQERQRSLELFSAGREPEWRNRLIWGDKKYVLPSLLPEFAGKVNLIYIDPPFDTGAIFPIRHSFPTTRRRKKPKPRPSQSNRLFSSKKPTEILGAADLIRTCNGFTKPLSYFENSLAKMAPSTCTLIGSFSTTPSQFWTRFLAQTIS